MPKPGGTCFGPVNPDRVGNGSVNHRGKKDRDKRRPVILNSGQVAETSGSGGQIVNLCP